jgi:hypothetical protein
METVWRKQKYIIAYPCGGNALACESGRKIWFKTGSLFTYPVAGVYRNNRFVCFLGHSSEILVQEIVIGVQ